MYEKDIIPDELAFKQYVSLLVGFGLSYMLFNQMHQYESLRIYLYITIGFIAAASLYVAFYIFKGKKIPLEKFEEYLKDKKLKIPEKQYIQMIFKMMVKVGSRIQMKKEKGLPPDESLDKVYSILLSEYDIIES
jgi:hypothetical protein